MNILWYLLILGYAYCDLQRSTSSQHWVDLLGLNVQKQQLRQHHFTTAVCTVRITLGDGVHTALLDDCKVLKVEAEISTSADVSITFHLPRTHSVMDAAAAVAGRWQDFFELLDVLFFEMNWLSYDNFIISTDFTVSAYFENSFVEAHNQWIRQQQQQQQSNLQSARIVKWTCGFSLNRDSLIILAPLSPLLTVQSMVCKFHLVTSSLDVDLASRVFGIIPDNLGLIIPLDSFGSEFEHLYSFLTILDRAGLKPSVVDLSYPFFSPQYANFSVLRNALELRAKVTEACSIALTQDKEFDGFGMAIPMAHEELLKESPNTAKSLHCEEASSIASQEKLAYCGEKKG